MIVAKHSHRGKVPRKMARAHNAAVKAGLLASVTFFHEELRDRRFTRAHAAAAGYGPRKKEYRKRKLRQKGHDRPLEWEGKTRELVKTQYRLSATSKTGRAIYAGARGFNRRHPASFIEMRKEFEKVLPEEIDQFVHVIDRRIEDELNSD